MKKVLKDFRFWFLVTMLTASVTISVAKIADLNWVIFQDEFDFVYAALLMFLFFAPVIIATWTFGFKRGVIACFVVGLLMFLQVIDSLQSLDLLPGVIAIVAIGISASWLVARQERGERLVRRSAEKLKCQAIELKSELTERRRAEERIRQAAEEWQTTFDSIADLVSIQDRDFRIVKVNRAFADFFKREPEELIGKACCQTVHGTNEPWPGCPHKQTLETNTPTTSEFYEPYLGTHIQVSTSPVFDEKGEVSGCVHIVKDISERKRMEEQLQHSQLLASLGEMTAGIAHEVNNPLGSIMLYSELLMENGVPPQVKKDLRVIHDEAKRAAKIMADLLTYGRRVKPQMRRLDLHSLLKKVLDMRRYEQRVRNISVSTNLLKGPL